MNKKQAKIITPESFCQIGIVVKSIDETIRYYKKAFGFGPFEIRYVDYPTATYYGKLAGYRGKRAFFNLGPIQIELIELIDGKTIHESFLKEGGRDYIILASKHKTSKKAGRRQKRRDLG